MEWYFYIVSWVLNFLIIAVIVALADEIMKARIEDHQTTAAFAIFVIPTALEIFSWYFFRKPFLFIL